MKKSVIPELIVLVIFLIVVAVTFETDFKDEKGVQKDESAKSGEYSIASVKVATDELSKEFFVFCKQKSKDLLECWEVDNDYDPLGKCEAYKQKERDLIEQKQGVAFPGVEGECKYAFKDSKFNGFSLYSYSKEMRVVPNGN